MKPICRLGDHSDHGGYITTAEYVISNGKAVATTGSMHVCPMRGHGTTPMTGSSLIKINGKTVVKVGDKARCGASMIEGDPIWNSD